jgi:hypothetical protein
LAFSKSSVYPKLPLNEVKTTMNRGFFRGVRAWTKARGFASLLKTRFEEEERQQNCRFGAHSHVRPFSWRSS